MHPHVIANIFLCLETLPTNITLELPQASVSEGVLVELRNGKESFSTFLAFVILNTTVSPQGVFGEVTLQGK